MSYVLKGKHIISTTMRKNIYYLMALLLVFTIGISSCTTMREREVEDEISEFRNWINDQSARIADRTEEDWKQSKEDFRVRTQELDLRQNKFSAELREEYQQLKEDFNNLDKEREKRRREAMVAEWDAKLLGSYADKTTISKENVREAYILFLENVRSMHGNWSNEDWEMAKWVMNRLDERKEEVDDELPTDDEVKIKALQMEFRTLETTNDVRGN